MVDFDTGHRVSHVKTEKPLVRGLAHQSRERGHERDWDHRSWCLWILGTWSVTPYSRGTPLMTLDGLVLSRREKQASTYTWHPISLLLFFVFELQRYPMDTGRYYIIPTSGYTPGSVESWTVLQSSLVFELSGNIFKYRSFHYRG